MSSLDKTALSATLHCLTGCSIGEVAGMVIGTALGLSNILTIIIVVILAFFFGYLLSLVPLLRSGMMLGGALGVAFAADTVSITVMEIVDNAAMIFIPGAMDASLSSFLFWGSLAIALLLAGLAAFPVNRYLIARGKGHALAHTHHDHSHH